MELRQLTSVEVREYVARKAAVVIPVGAVEQHGPHLPVITDTAIVEAVAKAATEVSGDLVAPAVPYGYNQKELSFAGTMSVTLPVLTSYLYDLCMSLKTTGFTTVLILNGHGWNKASISAVAHQVAESPGVICAATSYYDLIGKEATELRESEFPGGMSHACEFETSLALHLFPDLVKMERARKEISFPKSKHVWLDIVHPPKVTLPRPFDQLSQSGVIGDPTMASAEKGRLLYEAAVREVADLLAELRA